MHLQPNSGALHLLAVCMQAHRALRLHEVPLYDPSGINPRPGLASQLLRNWPALQLHSIQELGAASLEQLLEQQQLFGRLLAVRRVDAGDRTRCGLCCVGGGGRKLSSKTLCMGSLHLGCWVY